MQYDLRHKQLWIVNAVIPTWAALNFKNMAGKEMLEIF